MLEWCRSLMMVGRVGAAPAEEGLDIFFEQRRPCLMLTNSSAGSGFYARLVLSLLRSLY